LPFCFFAFRLCGFFFQLIIFSFLLLFFPTQRGEDLSHKKQENLTSVIVCSLEVGQQYWIGENIAFLEPLDQGAEVSLTWTDGSQSNSSVFAPQYSDSGIDGDIVCVSIDSNGTWYKEACDLPRSGFVCKRQAGGELRWMG